MGCLAFLTLHGFHGHVILTDRSPNCENKVTAKKKTGNTVIQSDQLHINSDENGGG